MFLLRSFPSKNSGANCAVDFRCALSPVANCRLYWGLGQTHPYGLISSWAKAVRLVVVFFETRRSPKKRMKPTTLCRRSGFSPLPTMVLAAIRFPRKGKTRRAIGHSSRQPEFCCLANLTPRSPFHLAFVCCVRPPKKTAMTWRSSQPAIHIGTYRIFSVLNAITAKSTQRM